MPEASGGLSLFQRFLQLPLLLRVCVGIIIFVFLLIFFGYQLSSAIRSSSQSQLASFKEAIGVSSTRELFNKYAQERVEKGGAPGFAPDALESFDFSLFQEDAAEDTEKGSGNLESRQEQVADSLVRYLVETANDKPYLRVEEVTFDTELPSFLVIKGAVNALVTSASRAIKKGDLEVATSRISDAIELIERATDLPIAISQMIRMGSLERVFDLIEEGLGEYEEEHLVLLHSRLEAIDLPTGFEGLVRGEVLMAAEVLFGGSSLEVELPQGLPPEVLAIDLWEYANLMFPVASAPLEVDWDQFNATAADIPWWAPLTKMVVISWGGIRNQYRETTRRLELLDEGILCLIAVARGEEAKTGNGYRLFRDEIGTWLEAVDEEAISVPLLIERVPSPFPGEDDSKAPPASSGKLDG